MNESEQEKQFCVGSFLKWRRESIPITQEHLSAQLCISRQTISNIENDNHDFSLNTFLRICDALDIRPSEFFQSYEDFINPKWRSRKAGKKASENGGTL